MARYSSSPAVSHTLTLTTPPPSGSATSLLANAAPMVLGTASANASLVKRSTSDDLPVALSPHMTSLNVCGGA